MLHDIIKRSKGRISCIIKTNKQTNIIETPLDELNTAHSLPSLSYPLYVAVVLNLTAVWLKFEGNTKGTAETQANPQPPCLPTLRLCSSSSCILTWSFRTITCLFHSGIAFPCSSWLGTRASTSARLVFRPDSPPAFPAPPFPLTTGLEDKCSWLVEADMVLADPEPVELGLGLGVVGGEVTGELDGGGDDGITGGLEGRVSGGDEKLPWSKRMKEENIGWLKSIFCFYLMDFLELDR